MTRWLSWLSELQPEIFCEVSEELARELGLENGGWATIATARGDLEARVLVTKRLRPLRIGGKIVHTVGIPYHFGQIGRVTGGVVNDLLAIAEDPNVNIMETKALTCSLVPGRWATGRRSGAVGPLDADRPVPELPRDLPGIGQPTKAPPIVRPDLKEKRG